jgi:hypothetical protein
MWELPEIVVRVAGEKQVARFARNDKRGMYDAGSHKIGDQKAQELLFTLKHSITVTNFTVGVWQVPTLKKIRGEWVAWERLPKVALTGLARKILRKVSPISRPLHLRPDPTSRLK